jgi:AcrR family transcriptional regulator
MSTTSTRRQPTGGRGARERILWAARRLFYDQGINATGMEQLTEVAHVSKRTFYQHFPGKDAVVAAYLAGFDSDVPTYREQALNRTELPPRERLLALFDPPPPGARLRGCPFHNAAVEVPDPTAPARTLIARHKLAFGQRLIGLAAEMGAVDPEVLGRQLAVVFEGAVALSVSLHGPAPFADARSVAVTLIDNATRKPG